jgi:sulfur-carrier protein adenylyltransferase/sulfurtransferase
MQYRELVARAKSEIAEIAPQEALAAAPATLFLDVRERDEWEEGHIPNAIHVSRGLLEAQIEQLVPDRTTPCILYCAVGARSALATKTLRELGYSAARSLTGGVADWVRLGLPLELPKVLRPEQRRRYARHLLIPEIGEAGQQRLLEARVLLIGAGGLGSPAALYLAAAGVGTIGIVDNDAVDESNLQRQILHSSDQLGKPKVDSARERLKGLNPDVSVVAYGERLTAANVETIASERWDVVVDGSDNFATRYLVNDACYWHRIPVVHGSIYRFEGQVIVFDPENGPCYRCLFPEPPPAELAPSCAEAGVLGVLPGVVGTLQAAEALKLLLEVGSPYRGRLLLYDALAGSFSELHVSRDASCPLCGQQPTITSHIPYQEVCSA